ncbi:DJ-1/PfpI family protein, partial [Psychromonas sp.]|nr:DJ-1/PfpI family protein [Psychromonas sp.]
MNIAIYIYPEAEVLDFSGPFEVFSTAKRISQQEWNIFFIAEHNALIEARGGMLIQPNFSIDDHPEIDLLIVVGGVHSEQIKNTKVINWIKATNEHTKKTASICTGAFLLAEAGLLNDLKVTTHWEDISDLQNAYPTLQVIENTRWIEEGKFITSAGISAGIDMSLYLLSKLTSDALAKKTAQ